jgi:hypothetical protein
MTAISPTSHHQLGHQQYITAFLRYLLPYHVQCLRPRHSKLKAGGLQRRPVEHRQCRLHLHLATPAVTTRTTETMTLIATFHRPAPHLPPHEVYLLFLKASHLRRKTVRRLRSCLQYRSARSWKRPMRMICMRHRRQGSRLTGHRLHRRHRLRRQRINTHMHLHLSKSDHPLLHHLRNEHRPHFPLMIM